MFTDSTDHNVFRALDNVIPRDKETYVKDLSEIWIRDALTGRLYHYIFRVLLEEVGEWVGSRKSTIGNRETERVGFGSSRFRYDD
jgi:hypothetical protein